MRANHLKTVFLAAVGLTATAPAQADVALSGYGELAGGGGFYDRSGAGDPHAQGSVAGSAHVNAAFVNGVNLQLDIEGKKDFLDTGFAAGSYGWSGLDKNTTYGLGGHFDLSGDDYRFGFLASIGAAEWSYHINRLFSAGLEGDWFLGRTTLSSQIVYSGALSGDYAGAGLRSLFLHTGTRYFLEDNLMLGAQVGAGVIDANPYTNYQAYTSPPSNVPIPYPVALGTRSGIGNGNMLNWGVGTEYRFENWPLSLGFDYRGSYATWRMPDVLTFYLNNGGSYVCNASRTYRRTEHLFMFRVRYYFGLESLFANDRKGASMNDHNPWYGAEPVAEADTGNPPPPPAC